MPSPTFTASGSAALARALRDSLPEVALLFSSDPFSPSPRLRDVSEVTPEGSARRLRPKEGRHAVTHPKG